MIELLVVIAIISLITFMVIPAVSSAREQSNRLSCQNKLKQIGLAVFNYEASNQNFPALSGMPNYSPNSNKVITDLKQYSAYVGLLSYLENTSLFNAFNCSSSLNDYSLLGSSSTDSSNATIAKVAINIFSCPSDSSGFGASVNYRFNLGTERWYSYGINSSDGPLTTYAYASTTQVTDGLTSTALASERSIGSRLPDQFTYTRDVILGGLGYPYSTDEFVDSCNMLSPQVAPRFCFSGTLWIVGTLSQTCYNHVGPPNSKIHDCLLPNYDPAPGMVSARSYHPNGVNLLFCDGSVKFIRETISKILWRSISTRAGGEVVDAEF